VEGLLAVLALAPAAWAQPLTKDEAVAKLTSAFQSKDEILQLEAIEESARLDEPEVIKRIARGLRAKSPAVRSAAMRALGGMRHPDGLKALHSTYRNDRQLRTNEELFALLLKSIGRHGDPGSVKILADHPFDHLTVGSGTARIMGLGNIRANASVEELVKASRKAGDSARRRRSWSDWRRKFDMPYRTALTVLTGKDLGASRSAWQDWWRQKRRTFKVPAARPRVPAEVSEYFERYWGVSYQEGGPAADRDPLGSPYGRIENPSAARVKEAVDDLKEAFKSKDDAVRVSAIEAHAGVIHPDVVRAIAQGLRGKSVAVRMAAVDALGWMKLREALKQLHRMYRREKDLSRQEELFAALLKAIGRHGDKSSIKVLASDPFKNLTIASGNARILGLGRIRERDSVETLMKGLRLTGQNHRRSRRASEPRFIDAFRASLAILTGEDVGASKLAWEQWWRENKRGFKMEKTQPRIPPDLQARWEAYWNEPYREGATG
jgi:HEAT repeat protein